MTSEEPIKPLGFWGKIIGFGLFLCLLRYGWQYTLDHPGDHRFEHFHYYLGVVSIFLFIVRVWGFWKRKQVGAGR